MKKKYVNLFWIFSFLLIISNNYSKAQCAGATGGVISKDTTVCTGNSIVLDLSGSNGTVQWQDSTSGGAWADVTTGSGGTTTSYTTPVLSSDIFYRVVATDAGVTCTDTSASIKVTIASSIAGIALPDTAICENDSLTLRLSGQVGNIQWQDSTLGHTWQDITGFTSANQNTGALLTDEYYRALVSLGLCSQDTSNTVHITVKPKAVGGIAGNDTTICNGSPANVNVTGYTGILQWQSSFDNVAFIDTVGLTNPTESVNPISGPEYIRVKVDNAGCIAYSNSVTVNVDQPAFVSSASNDTTICQGDIIPLNIYGYSGNIQWQSSGDSIIFADSSLQTSATIQVNPLSKRFYRAKLVNGVCSAVYSRIIAVNVNMFPVGGNAGPNGEICNGDSTLIRLTAYSGSAIQWQDSSSIAPGLWSDISGQNLDSTRIKPLTTTFYRAKLNNGNCIAFSSTAKVMVDSPSNAGTTSSDQQVCKGSNVKLTISGYNGSIQWQTSADSVVFADSTGQTADSLLINAGSTRFYRARVTNLVCQPALSSVIKVTVDPTSIGGKVFQSQTICLGATRTLKLRNYTGSALQWESSTDSINYNPVVGQIDTALIVNPTVSTFYRVQVTSGTCSSVYSDTAKVTVVSLNAGTVSANKTTICSYNNVILSLKGSKGNILWQSSVTGSSPWTDIAAATDSVYSASPLLDTYYRAKVSNGICTDVFSNSVKITVQQGAQADSALRSQTICSGNSTMIYLKGNTGTIQWESSPDSLSWNSVPTAITSTYYTPSLTDTVFYRAVVTNGTCTDTSNGIKITVLPPAKADSITPSQSICIGSSSTITIYNYNGVVQWQQSNDGRYFTDMTVGSVPSITVSPTDTTYYRAVTSNGVCADTSNITSVKVFKNPASGVVASSQNHCTGTTVTIRVNGSSGKIQWQKSLSPTTGFVDIAGATADTLDVSDNVTTYFKVVVSSGPCLSVQSNTIVLNAIPGSLGGTLSATNDTLCSSSLAQLAVTSSRGDIQWNGSANGTTWSLIPGVYNDTYEENISATKYYRVGVTNNTCPMVYSNSVKVIVKPGVVIGAITNTKDSICINDTLNLRLVGSIGNIQWQKSVNGNTWASITGANLDNINTGVLTADVYYRAYVSNSFCSDTTPKLHIVVNQPAKGGVIDENYRICKGETVKLHLNNYSGNILWQHSQDQVTFVDIPTEFYQELAVTPLLTTYYRAKIYVAGCSSAYSSIDTVVVIQQPEPGTAYRSQTIRPGTIAQLELKHFIGDTIQWQSSPDTLNFKDIKGATKVKLDVSPETNTYYRTRVSSATCFQYSNPVLVTIDLDLLRISPIPSKDKVRVRFNLSENQEFTVKIFDMVGKEMMERVVQGIQGLNEVEMDISSLAGGPYYITIGNHNNIIQGKILKEE